MHHYLHTLVCVFLFLLALPCRSSAQVGLHRSDLAVGFGGGYAMSTVGFVPKVPQAQHGGPTFGFTMRYTCEKYFSSICAIVAEANYVQLGWKEDILTVDDAPVVNPLTGLAEAYRRDISYLQVPVLARLGWGRERRGLQAFFQVGPQFGVCLGESTNSNFTFGSQNMSERTSQIVAQDTMPIQHRFDYGISAGLGIELSAPRLGHILLEGRYYYGLGDIYGNTKRDYFGRSNNSSITLRLAFLFDIAKTKDKTIK